MKRIITVTVFGIASLVFALPVAAAAPVGARPPTQVPEVIRGNTVTLAFTGDMLVHNRIARKAAELAKEAEADFDFTPMFDEVRSVISAADLAICHQEVTLDVPGHPIGVFPRLSAPGEFASAVAGAGYDGCSTASNHSTDYGTSGIESTIAVLDEAGLGHTGTATTEVRSHGVLYELDHLTVGHLSATYGVQVYRPEHEWSVGLIDTDRIIADAEALKEGGADWVVVSLHWGSQYRVSTTAQQLSVADTLTASDAIDMIVGHHAHVLQAVERVNGKLVAYGLGNFLSNQSAGYSGPNTEDGAVLMIRLRSDSEGSWSLWDTAYMPTWVHRKAGGYTIWPALGPSPEDLSPRYQEQSAARSLKNFTFDGRQVPGLSGDEAVAWLESDPKRGRFWPRWPVHR
ncbi:MAG: CapA family protein [Armatimonadetes bacterium]|nr:MAG: CapA family protein [Armatimonadota bacterium]